MKYEEISQQILDGVGGRNNVQTLDHCATRLRFILKDKSLLNKKAIEQIKGILGIAEEQEFQVVLGKEVKKIYKILVQEKGVHGIKRADEPVYNTSPTWRIAFFTLNNTATNMYMFSMMYVSYYATGIAGLGVALIGVILTAMRLWDGITDPIIGFFIDKTNGKYGKFRPFMIAGNIILGVMVLIIYNTTHLIPEEFRLLYFILMYALYIIGYTCQTACTKAGQACMTNDPKMRPKFGLFDSIFNSVIMTGVTLLISNYLVPKYGGFSNQSIFTELNIIAISLSALFTIMAVIGIWKKDRTEFFGLGEKGVQVKFKDYWPVLKGNRALQMLIIAASTDKLAMSVATNATVAIMLFGIIIGDFALSGLMGLIVLLPTVLLVMIGTRFAQKSGQKKALVFGTWVSIISHIALLLFLWFGDPTQIRLNNFGIMTIGFILLYTISKGAIAISGAFVIPMISDCADYETSISGRFVPGMMGTLFSFIDKLISSFSTTIITLSVAAIGFTTTLPDVTDSVTPALFWLTMFLFIGMPICGWVASLISMKFYPLDKKKMTEVQEKIAAVKAAATEENV